MNRTPIKKVMSSSSNKKELVKIKQEASNTSKKIKLYHGLFIKGNSPLK